MRRNARASLLAVAVAFSPVAYEARAAEPLHVEVAALAGGGSFPVEAVNALGPGLGARAGIAAYGFYAGVSVVDYFGAGTGGVDGFGMGGTYSAHALLYGVELGYGPDIGPVTVRAVLGLGDYAQRIDTQAVDLSTGMAEPATHATFDYLYLEPGITVVGSIGRLLLGADASLFTLASGPQQFQDTGFTLHAQVGAKF